VFGCVPNCSQITNSISMGITIRSCACENGFFWNGGNCQRNCSAIAGARRNTDVLNCSCMLGKNLTWNGRICLGFTEPTNCSNISWTNGTNTNGSCYCISNFYWDNTLKLCRANCSAITNAINPSSLTSCSCIENFYWDGVLCRLNCSNMSWTQRDKY
jgi:hypothetical protein